MLLKNVENSRKDLYKKIMCRKGIYWNEKKAKKDLENYLKKREDFS